MATTAPNSTPQPQNEAFQPGGSLSELLDRLEVRAGKIGMNSPEQSFELLAGLDAAREKLNRLEGATSRKIAESQFADITARLQSEAARFLKDLGGAGALRAAREERQPPAENWWWYLDTLQDRRRKSGLRRAAFTLFGLAFGVALAALIYNLFFAPDPATVARYEAETRARDLMMQGNLAEALAQVESGLASAPQDPALLTLKGVILQQQGQDDPAQTVLAEAEKNAASQEEFFNMLGQAYLLVGRHEDALASAQEMLRVNPQSPQAYMLIGQIHEATHLYALAFDDYTKAYDLADAQNQTQLAGLARVKMAMVLQLMNSPAYITPTASSAP